MAKDTQFDEMLESVKPLIDKLRITNKVRRDGQALRDARKNLDEALLELIKTRRKLVSALSKAKRSIND